MFKYWKFFKKQDKAFILLLIAFTIIATILAIFVKEYMFIFTTFSLIINICFLYIANVYEYIVDETQNENVVAINLIKDLISDNEKQQKQIKELKRMLSKAKAKKKNKEEK